MPEPINITFLGTGSAIPSVRRSHPAILIQYKGDYMLFDCGEGTQVQMQKAGISPMKLSRIFISHWHADHFAGLLPLIESLHLSRRKEPLDVYGPEASRFIDALVELSYWGIGFEIDSHDCNEEKEVEKIYENDSFEIYAIKVKHSVPAFGFCIKEKDSWNIEMKRAKKFGLSGLQLKRLKKDGSISVGDKTITIEDVAKMKKGRKIVYSGDTIPCKELFEFSEGADILIHDGTFAEPTENDRPHSSASEIASLSKEYKIKKLILTHLSGRYKNDDEVLNAAKANFKNTTVAKDLMKITLD